MTEQQRRMAWQRSVRLKPCFYPLKRQLRFRKAALHLRLDPQFRRLRSALVMRYGP